MNYEHLYLNHTKTQQKKGNSDQFYYLWTLTQKYSNSSKPNPRTYQKHHLPLPFSLHLSDVGMVQLGLTSKAYTAQD